MDKAQLKLYDPNAGGGFSESCGRKHPLPVQPEGGDHRRRPPSGSARPQRAPRRPGRRSSAGPSRASSRWRCSSTRRASRTAAWSRQSRCCSAAPSRRRRASARRSRARRSSYCTGDRSPASRPSSPRSARSTPSSVRAASRSGPCARWPSRRCPTSPGRQNPTSGSENVRQSHLLIAGDTLASVAYAEYGDPSAWRAVARFNGIDDPLRCRPGMRLLLPSPEEL